jgi:hypothetical protein
MYDLLDVVSNILLVNKIPHHLEAGTLLGFVRDKKIMDHDTDVDVSIYYDDWNVLTTIDFSKYGLVKCREDARDTGFGRVLSLKFPHHSMYCDVYANPAFPLLAPLTVKNKKGEEKTYNIPIKPEIYLFVLYGDWRTPSGKHADWPKLYYNELLTSAYKPYWDIKYKVLYNLHYSECELKMLSS